MIAFQRCLLAHDMHLCRRIHSLANASSCQHLNIRPWPHEESVPEIVYLGNYFMQICWCSDHQNQRDIDYQMLLVSVSAYNKALNLNNLHIFLDIKRRQLKSIRKSEQ